MIFRASVPSVQATDLPRGSEHGVLGQDKLRWGPLESLMGAILAFPLLADVSHRDAEFGFEAFFHRGDSKQFLMSFNNSDIF